MPITRSAAKALRQSKRRALRNLRRKESYKNIVKRVRKLAAEKKIDEAAKLIPLAYQAIDKAAKNKVIEKNTAARKKSQLMRWLKKT